MMTNNILLLAIASIAYRSLQVAAALPALPTSFEVVLRGNDSVRGGETRFYHDGLCKIDFPDDGYLFAPHPSGSSNDWNKIFAPNPNSFCKDGTGPVRYKQQTDGNFVIYCNGEADYMTHSIQGTRGDFVMVIDKECHLFIVEGTLDCDSIGLEHTVWASELFEPLGVNDRLYKGQYLHQDGYELQVDPYYGILTVKLPAEGGGYWTVWQSGDYDEPPANHHDFYAKVTAQGRLILVAIDYTSGPRLTESEYFSKDLNPTTDCFTLGIVQIEDGHGVGSRDLVAVPCDDGNGNGGRRVRTLRGGAV